MAGECPRPIEAHGTVILAHGEGARATRRLLHELILPALGQAAPTTVDDAAPVLETSQGRILVTTDSYVVTPYEFPGGNIGSLAVHGSLNDLAVCGARPLALTLSLIIEEGFPLQELQRLLKSAAEAANRWQLTFASGDTKVVPKGACDKIFINTTAIGLSPQGLVLGPELVQPGDVLSVSGTIGEHGMAVMAVREGFDFVGDLRSDSAPVCDQVAALLDRCHSIRFMRDPTRGGVAAVLHELAQATKLTIVVEEERLPVRAPVRAACELLGLDPLYVACEGRFVAVLGRDEADLALQTLEQAGCEHPAIIGAVESWRGAPVLVRSPLGPERVLDEPTGSPLPRIC